MNRISGKAKARSKYLFSVAHVHSFCYLAYDHSKMILQLHLYPSIVR